MPKALKRILYAEDEEDIKAIAEIALVDIANFELTHCRNGLEVLSIAKNIIPDLLLFDVMMPEMDGPTTLRALRKLPEYKNIPAIFMTAKIQPNEVQLYKSMGVIEVIAKPFDPMKLSDQIQKAWEKFNATDALNSGMMNP